MNWSFGWQDSEEIRTSSETVEKDEFANRILPHTCIFRIFLLGEIKFSLVGRIRRCFDQILGYEAYFPLAPLLSECILGPPGENFPYIVDHAVEQPLDVDFDPPP